MRYALIAIQWPSSMSEDDIMQSAFEAMGDVEVSDLTLIDESSLPASAYRMDWDS